MKQTPPTFLSRAFSWHDFRRSVLGSDEYKQLIGTVAELTRRGLTTTTTGQLDTSNLTEPVSGLYSTHTERAWEYCVVADAIIRSHSKRVLDCGGASSPLIFMLASRGLHVTTVDLQHRLVGNARDVAAELGWPLTAVTADMVQLPFADKTFDAVVSISVLEHMPHAEKARAMREMERVVRPGGLIGLTFDYGRSVNARTSYDYEMHDQFHTPLRDEDDVRDSILARTSLRLAGPITFPQRLECDRGLVRRAWLHESLRYRNRFDLLKNLAKRAVAYSPWFRSPYFAYTVFALFLRRAS